MALAAKEKKRNEEEEEEEREENFFKWRDLYAWRRRVLLSARRAREQEDEERRASLESSASLEEDEEKEWTRSMSTSTYWMSTHLKYRLAVCDDKSVFTCDPREGGGLLKVLTNALTSIAFLVTLVLPVVVLTTPHGMGGRKHRNEDDDDDEADDGNQPVTNPNPFVPPAGTYLPVLSEEETESVDDKNETETENAGDDIRASGLAEPLLGDGDGVGFDVFHSSPRESQGF